MLPVEKEGMEIIHINGFDDLIVILIIIIHSMILVPFTVTGALLLIAFCTSKLQYPESFLLIALHSVLGPFETGTLIFSLVTYLGRGQTESIYTILFVVSLAIIGGLNLFSLIIQTPVLLVDSHF